MDKTYELNDIVEMRKPHACQTNRWKIVKMGVDMKIKCINCDRLIILPRVEFEKRLKKILEKANN